MLSKMAVSVADLGMHRVAFRAVVDPWRLHGANRGSWRSRALCCVSRDRRCRLPRVYGRLVGALVLALLLCSYAGFLELGQNWAPGRHPQVIDFLSSTAGVLVGMVPIRLWNAVQASRDI